MESPSKGRATLLIFMICMVTALPPIHACVPCVQPHPPQPPYHRHPGPGHGQPKIPPNPKPPTHRKPPHHGGGGGGHPPPKSPSPVVLPPPVIVYPPPVIISPPIINPPVITPPVTVPPPSSPTYPPYTGPPSGGAPGIGPITPVPSPPAAAQTCPIDALKLGLCVDVLGGLVHIGLGDPVQNTCCPVLGGLLELEAAVCLCTAIRIKLLNINIFIPLALQALITCGKTPPPGFVCPPL